MSLNYTADTSPDLADWEAILDHYHQGVDEDDVWQIARQYDEVPMMNNIYQSLVLERLTFLFCELTGLSSTQDCVEIEASVNAISSHFYIDGDTISSKQEFFDKVEEVKAIIQ